MQTIRIAIIILALVASAAGCRQRQEPIAAPPGEKAAVSQAKQDIVPSGRIAFTRRFGPLNRDREIWTMAADGSEQTKLTGHPPRDFAPIWSPDGGRIAFVSKRDGNAEIYVMKSDGTEQTRLTRSQAVDLVAAWSPNGSSILFTRRLGPSVVAPQEIWVADAAGASEVKLTGDPAGDFYPAWSPDGSKIAFESKRDGNAEIYVMNADGTGQVRLTRNTVGDFDPVWSADGRRIAFNRSCTGIWIMNADGSKQTPLRGSEPNDMFPVWSPDGQKIACDGHGEIVGPVLGWVSVGRDSEIYVMNASGGDRVRLTSNGAWDAGAVWSPDGSKIAFTSDRDGDREVYMMNPDGSDQLNITNNPAADDQEPAWWAPRRDN